MTINLAFERNNKTVGALNWLGHVIANYVTGDMDHASIAGELREQTYEGLSDDFGDKARHLDTALAVSNFHKALAFEVGESVRLARQAGATWDEIGTVFDISRQAAQQRFGGVK